MADARSTKKSLDHAERRSPTTQTLTFGTTCSRTGETSRPSYLALPASPTPPGNWTDRLVWDKRRPGMNGGPWRYTHEAIYARGFVRNGNGNFSILTQYPADQDLHIHAKPVALMEALLSVAPPGIIADPFSGSGATLIAARNLGRKVIGVELEERYCELIATRLAQQAFDFGGL